MRRIDARTVDLTDAEMEASVLFDEGLSQGLGIEDAVRKVREQMLSADIELDEDFYVYLLS